MPGLNGINALHRRIAESKNHRITESNIHSIKKRILPIIVFSQFAGTSLWFAGNAILGDLQTEMNFGEDAIGNITSSVQLGFIFGTLVFAFLSIADRFSPTKVFLFSAFGGAFFNLAVCWFGDGYEEILCYRFLTGFFLAGIYPVGMKIAADWYAEGLGKALGYLVGALVLGTAFPHLLKDFSGLFSWQGILAMTSGLAVLGGLILFFFVGDGPHRKKGTQFKWDAILTIFKFKNFRAAAFGYFGHMWELYTFWAFVPIILITFNETNGSNIAVAYWSFLIIGIGAVGCIVGGYISLKKGSASVAFGMLLISGICCLFSPAFYEIPEWLFLLMMCIWGFTVVGDSPQFSTIVAKTAPKKYVGTALTIVNCIGFGLTIFSIQLVTFLFQKYELASVLPILIIGPIIGLFSIKRLLSN